MTHTSNTGDSDMNGTNTEMAEFNLGPYDDRDKVTAARHVIVGWRAKGHHTKANELEAAMGDFVPVEDNNAEPQPEDLE